MSTSKDISLKNYFTEEHRKEFKQILIAYMVIGGTNPLVMNLRSITISISSIEEAHCLYEKLN